MKSRKRKTYKRSENCELAYVSVAWNILDKEQWLDFEYISDSTNEAGRIRECVRAMRLGLMPTHQNNDFPLQMQNVNELECMEEASDEEAIEWLTS